MQSLHNCSGCKKGVGCVTLPAVSTTEMTDDAARPATAEAAQRSDQAPRQQGAHRCEVVGHVDGGLRAQKKAAARAAMHRAALELVADHGVSGVTAEEIAQRAGVSTRTFFNYWPSKEAAVLGIDDQRNQDFLADLRERCDADDVRPALREAVAQWMRSGSSDPELRGLKSTVIEREPALHRVSSAVFSSLQEDIVAIIAERIGGEDRHDRAVVWVQMIFAVTRSAYALSMRNGTDVLEEYRRALAFVDEGRARC